MHKCCCVCGYPRAHTYGLCGSCVSAAGRGVAAMCLHAFMLPRASGCDSVAMAVLGCAHCQLLSVHDVQVLLCARVCVCMHVYMCIPMRVHTHACVHMQVPVPMCVVYVYARTCAYAYIFMPLCVCVLAHGAAPMHGAFPRASAASRAHGGAAPRFPATAWSRFHAVGVRCWPVASDESLFPPGAGEGFARPPALPGKTSQEAGAERPGQGDGRRSRLTATPACPLPCPGGHLVPTAFAPHGRG